MVHYVKRDPFWGTSIKHAQARRGHEPIRGAGKGAGVSEYGWYIYCPYCGKAVAVDLVKRRRKSK